MARSALAWIAAMACVTSACARLLGAEFEDARLDPGREDAGGDDASGLVGLPELDGAPRPDAFGFDVQAPGMLSLWLSAERGATGAPVDAEDAGEDADAAELIAPPFPDHGVVEWQDQSGQGHHLTQPRAVRRPSVNDGGPGGQAAVTFEARRRTCLVAPFDGGLGTAGATLFVVTRGAASSLVRFQTVGPGDSLVFPFDARGADAGGDPGLSVSVPGEARFVRVARQVGSWEVLTARLHPGRVGGLETWRDGVPAERGSLLTDAMPSVDTLSVGCALADPPDFAEGDVAEILVYTGVLDDLQRQLVEGYLRAKWRL